MLKLAGLFIIAAILYAAVGFGGGSTYSALLVLAKTDYLILPSLALICNIIVVIGGTFRFHKAGLIPWHKIWPLFALSVPLAWVGGRIYISETFFVTLLGLTLLIAGLTLLFQYRGEGVGVEREDKPFKYAFIGGGLGLVSGLVGIGGGIFLAPVLHLMRWGRVKVIAGVCSAFILVNSLAGLLGQLMKLNDLSYIFVVLNYWPLFLAVLVGGQIGSHLGSGPLNPKWVKMLTSLLILFVAIRLLLKSASAL